MPTPAAPTPSRDGLFAARDRLFLIFLSAAAIALGLRGILRFSYVGQDFVLHRALILLFPHESLSYYFKFTNPPALYWFGSLVHEHVSADHYLEVVALCFLILNVSALWLFYGFLWKGIANWQLRYGAAAFITLVPFRVIHSIVIAADAFTIPVFALVALLTFRLFGNPRGVLSWAGLSLSLAAGMFCKYTFSGVLPPIALLLGFAVATRLGKGERLRWCVIGALSLALPSEVFLLEMYRNAEQKGPISHAWLREGEPPQMRWSDILMVKEADMGLLSAPEFYRDRIFETRKYSYPGLLHLASVTDSMNLFQRPPSDLPAELRDLFRTPSTRDRTPLSQVLQAWSVRWCLALSALAVAGTIFCGVLSAASLLTRRPLLPDSTVVMAALAAGYYSPVFLFLTRLNDAYGGAFWLPRLVMPAILAFFSLGFVAVDYAYARLDRRRPVAAALLALFSVYVVVACLVFVGFLY
jgi:hypothetical protein